MLGIPDALYWRLTPSAFGDLVDIQRRVREAEDDRQRQVLQWTAGVAIEWVLRALQPRVRGLEPADFYALPRRAELWGEPDGLDALRTVVALTLGRGGQVPTHVLELLEREV